MSSARLFKVENRLSKVMGQPGGRSLMEALRSAQARVEAVRERSIARIAIITGQLRDSAVQGRLGDRNATRELYRAANDIFALAGFFEMNALSEAAFSLCDLMIATEVGSALNWAAVDLHVDAIAVLQTLKPEADAAKLLAGLRALCALYAPRGAISDNANIAQFDGA